MNKRPRGPTEQKEDLGRQIGWLLMSVAEDILSTALQPWIRFWSLLCASTQNTCRLGPSRCNLSLYWPNRLVLRSSWIPSLHLAPVLPATNAPIFPAFLT